MFLFFSQNIHVCTVYTNLGDDAVVHALKETEVTTIVTSHELLPRFKLMLDSLPNIRTIVYLEDQLQKVILFLKAQRIEQRYPQSNCKNGFWIKGFFCYNFISKTNILYYVQSYLTWNWESLIKTKKYYIWFLVTRR